MSLLCKTEEKLLQFRVTLHRVRIREVRDYERACKKS